MGRRPGQTKPRMLASAITLLRERGAAGVTVDAVLAHSGAPRGSVYHHFPGGRTELLLGATRQAGEFIGAMLDEAARHGAPLPALESFVVFWKRALADSDHRAGCPIVALAVDSRQDIPEAAELVAEIFGQWHEKLSALLVADGFPAERAGRLATLAVAAIEGAVILCRARRDSAPLDDVLAELSVLISAR